MNTNFLLSLLTAIKNRFKAIEADLTNKAVDTEKQIANLYNARRQHLEEAAKASRVGRAIEALLTPTDILTAKAQDVSPVQDVAPAATTTAPEQTTANPS